MGKNRSLIIAIIGIVVMSIFVTFIYASANVQKQNSVVGAAVSVCAQYAADRNYWCAKDVITVIWKAINPAALKLYNQLCASAEAGLMNPDNHCLPSNAPLN